MEAVAFIVVVLAIYGVVNYFKNAKKRHLDFLISECSSQKLGVKCHIYRAEEQVAPQYRLNDSERVYVSDIAQEFQRQLDSASYLQEIMLPKTKYEVQPIDFVTAELTFFLRDHLDDEFFAGHRRYDKEISRDSYSKTCQLTDFGVTYQKVYYICANYLANNKAYSPDSTGLSNAKRYTDTIDTRTINIALRIYEDQDFIYRRFRT